MISNRPILYLTLPSLALIIGYVWLRRKKGGRAVCDTGGTNQKSSNSNKSCKILGEHLGDNQELSNKASSSSYSTQHNSQHSESLPIGTPQQNHNKLLKLKIDQETSTPPGNNASGKQAQSPGSAPSSSSSSLGKSAPIDIAPNPRSPPKRITEQEIDCEILKLKPQESDIKHLRYIEEPENDWDESPTPADSPLYRDRFDLNRHQPKVEPIVIKGTMEAKISPENSFRERKYTQTESDDSGRLNETSKDESETNNENIQHCQQEGEEEEMKTTDNGCVMMQEDAEVVATTTEMPKKCQSTPSSCLQPQIASPSLSVCSMHSGDSGQGSSPPQSVGAPQITYDFVMPTAYVGSLIGYRGTIITNIKEKTGANVIVRKGSHGPKKQKVVSIEGTQSEVDAALKMIRLRLPEKKYPFMSMDRIFVTPDNKVVPTFNASTLSLQLIEGINNDVTISAIVSGGHLFLHQPLHPSYPALSSLQYRMNQWYSKTMAPELPDVIDSAICAVCYQDNWYRVQIVSHNSQTKTSLVKYLDFGGYSTVDSAELRQIHADFMTVPFQAIECVMSNIRPPSGSEWSKEAADTISSFTQGVILQAQIAGYTPDDIPEVYLFVSITKDNVLFINQELCARKLAEWIDTEQEG
ncbi:CLUMA_CG019060, isoform A [Clunio marinus]|uniref:CLUMA_CG019060, isoform A n=1 Tax=Clunio marinus TaxID=568069 RepID=A0A1J1J543_9DIPT|nr:CLUMA_CG019060, isoform A [Clunio marinus]